jgi:hypothetical protein
MIETGKIPFFPVRSAASSLSGSHDPAENFFPKMKLALQVRQAATNASAAIQ